MPIEVTCDACFYSFSARDEHAGKRGKCPECGAAVIVPGKSAGRSAPAPSRSESSARRPASSSRASAPSPSANNTKLLIGGLGALVVVGVIGFVAFRMGRAGQAQPAPVPSQPVAASTPVSAQNPPVNPAPAIPPASNSEPAAPQQQTAAKPAVTTPAGLTPAVASPNPAGTTPATPVNPADTAATKPDTPAETKPYGSVADLVAAVEPSACRISVRLQNGSSLGSGFVVDRDGTVVTNYHVIAGAVEATVVFPDRSQGKVLGYHALDPKMDLAILKIDYPSDKLKPVKLAADEPRKGEEVVAIGAPLGLEFSMSEGKVSAVRDADALKAYGGDYVGTWVQTSAPISPGNSGGPLFNMKGEVIAANTMSLAGEGAQNLNFGTSAENIRTLLKKKTNTIIAMTPAAAPALASSRSRGGGRDPNAVVDETKTERGKKLLGQIKEILLFDINISFDSSGKITEYVSNSAERMWKQAGVDVTRRRDAPALMVVLMRFKQAGSSANAKTLEVQTMILVVDTSGPQPQKVKVWDETDELGSVSEGSLARGVIPERMRSKVTEFFGKLRTAYKTAGEADKPADAKK